MESHKNEIYSVSVSPDGSRLASGGLDGNVRIWSVADILRYKDQNLPKDEHCKPLCSMARHNGAVTCVKFSPDGRFLASGSDDKVLLIWEKDEESRPSFGEQNVEHWTVTKRVVAHDNDIQDIAWAPDSSILVSVGLDRSVIIYSGSTFEKLKRFDVHQSTVKGVVFDPANKYFATASDDRSIRVFRYHKGPELSFSIERTILAPFKQSPLTTYFRRLSWSPDGQHIAATNATNGPVTSVAIINRGSWDSDFSLIGHETPCEVASFSPALYEFGEGENKGICSVVATGGQDKNLVVWSTVSPTPIAIFEDMTYKTITDLTWTPNGQTLFCSSLDGTISVINFEENELGVPISPEKNDELLNKYGVDKDSLVFPESTEQLILEDKAAEFQKTLNDKHLDRLLTMETTAKPKPIAPPKVNILPVRKVEPKQLSTAKGTEQNKDQPKLNKVQIRNGKKRVMPTLISASHTSSTHDKFKSITITKTKEEIKDTKLAIAKVSQTPYDIPRVGVQTSIHGYYIKKTSPEDEEDENDDLDYYDESEEDEAESIGSLLNKRRKKQTDKNLIKLHPELNSDSMLVTKTTKDKTTDDLQIIEALNYYTYDDDDDEDVTIIRGYFNEELSFETFVQDTILSITGTFNKFWALATNSAALLIISPTGRILYPRIELGFNVNFMVAKEDLLLIVTDDFIIHVFDLLNFKKVIKDVSLSSILNYEIKINEKSIISDSKILDIEIINGTVLVTLKNNEIYMYNNDLKVWVKIIDNFYRKYNQFKQIYIEETQNHDHNVLIGDELEEYVKKLVFLENYETTMKLIDNSNYENITNKLNAHKTQALYSKVRA